MSSLVKIPGLWILDTSGAVRIEPESIMYCFHYDSITQIVYSCGRLTRVNLSLKRIENKLCNYRFYRCHRNYIINLDQVGKYLQKDDTFSIPNIGSIPVSRRRRNKLRNMLEMSNPQ